MSNPRRLLPICNQAERVRPLALRANCFALLGPAQLLHGAQSYTKPSDQPTQYTAITCAEKDGCDRVHSIVTTCLSAYPSFYYRLIYLSTCRCVFSIYLSIHVMYLCIYLSTQLAKLSKLIYIHLSIRLARDVCIFRNCTV